MVSSSLSRNIRTGLIAGLAFGVMAALVVRSRPPAEGQQPETIPAIGRFFERLELSVLDFLASEHARSRESSPRIALLNVDEEALVRARRTLGAWPWQRSDLGAFAEELKRLGARMVVLEGPWHDPSQRGRADDDRFAERLGAAKAVALGFRLAPAAEEEGYRPAPWALFIGSYSKRAAALLSAARVLEESIGGPYLIDVGDKVELWWGGFRDRASALQAAERLHPEQGKEPRVRELSSEESLARLSREALFSEQAAIAVRQAPGQGLASFQIVQAPVAPLLTIPAAYGNAGLDADEDGLVRSVRHLVKCDGRYFPSLSMAAALALAGQTDVAFDAGRIQIGDSAIPVDHSGRTLLRFYGRREHGQWMPSPYPTISALSVLKSLERRQEGRSPDEKLAEKVRDRIIFLSIEPSVGSAAALTPLGRGSTALVHAAALDNLLRGEGLVRASEEQDSAAAFAMALLGALVSMVFTRTARMGRTAVVHVSASFLAGGGYLFWAMRSYQQGTWVACAVPLTGFLMALFFSTAAHYVDDSKTSNLVREALGRAANADTIDRILRNPQHFSLAGEQRAMTVYLFALGEPAALGDKLKPQEQVKLLNEIYAELASAVELHQGHVDRLSGEAAGAFWGAPLPNHEHALEACRCALRVRDALARRRAQWQERYGVEVQSVAGLNTGDLIVGNLGSADGPHRKMSYTVMGEAARVAQRLKRANELWGTDILVGEATYEAVKSEFEVRELDLVRARGRDTPVRIFELLTPKGRLSNEQRAFLARFAEARQAFLAREFVRASQLFEELARARPGDGPTALSLARCQQCLLDPPGEGWDGVFAE